MVSLAASQRVAGDALRPGEAVGARLEFTGDQRRPPERANQCGESDKCRAEQLEQLVHLAEIDRHVATVSGGDARRLCLRINAVEVAEVRPGQGEDNANSDEDDEGCCRLRTKLSPTEPHHSALPRFALRGIA